MRTSTEIRAELEHWKTRQRAARTAKQPIEAAYAAIIVGALAYALGEAPSAATRIDAK